MAAASLRQAVACKAKGTLYRRSFYCMAIATTLKCAPPVDLLGGVPVSILLFPFSSTEYGHHHAFALAAS